MYLNEYFFVLKDVWVLVAKKENINLVIFLVLVLVFSLDFFLFLRNLLL